MSVVGTSGAGVARSEVATWRGPEALRARSRLGCFAEGVTIPPGAAYGLVPLSCVHSVAFQRVDSRGRAGQLHVVARGHVERLVVQADSRGRAVLAWVRLPRNSDAAGGVSSIETRTWSPSRGFGSVRTAYRARMEYSDDFGFNVAHTSPSVAASARGRAALAWVDARYRVRLAVGTTAGGVRGAKVVGAGSRNGLEIGLTITSAGRATVVYSSLGLRRSVYAADMRPGADRAHITTLASRAEPLPEPVLAADDDGDMVAAWASGGGRGCLLRARSAHGRWQTARQGAPAAADVYSDPSLAADVNERGQALVACVQARTSSQPDDPIYLTAFRIGS